jgi:dUTP pyrophosphatase
LGKTVRLGKNVNCHVCNKEFYCNPKRLQAKTICCTKKCAATLTGARLSKKIEVECLACGKKIQRKASQNSRVLYPSCSMECKRKVRKKYRTGSKNSNYKNRKGLDKKLHERAGECNRRAILKGIEGNLTAEDLKTILIKQEYKCFYTGHPIDFNKKSAYSFSVDRIDSTKGYTVDNVVICCLAINYMKSNFDIYDITQLFESYMKNKNNKIPTKIINKSNYPVTKNSYENVGIDLYANEIEDCGTYIKVKTGIHVQPPKGFYFDLVVRSSTHKKGLMLYNDVGIIDQSYTGEIIAVLYKTADFKELPKVGDRLVQLIPRRSLLVEFIEVSELDSSERGNNGFGSSGV